MLIYKILFTYSFSPLRWCDITLVSIPCEYEYQARFKVVRQRRKKNVFCINWWKKTKSKELKFVFSLQKKECFAWNHYDWREVDFVMYKSIGLTQASHQIKISCKTKYPCQESATFCQQGLKRSHLLQASMIWLNCYSWTLPGSIDQTRWSSGGN